MNLYYGINQTHRWPSTANKHIQVVLCCSASWPAWQHPRGRVAQRNPTRVRLRFCARHTCVLSRNNTSPLIKKRFGFFYETFCESFARFFMLNNYTAAVLERAKSSTKISLFVFIRLFPPFGSELHLFLHFHNFNFFFFLQSLTPPLPRGSAGGLGR